MSPTVPPISVMTKSQLDSAPKYLNTALDFICDVRNDHGLAGIRLDVLCQ